MSIAPTGGGDLAIPDDEMTGLEDVETSDLVMPRINIDHKTAEFIDNLSGSRFPEMNVILLGLVKQRILWDDEVNEGDKPLCKSFNAKEGNPDVARFPWSAAQFDLASQPADDDGRVVLPCASCNLKEWGTDPKGKAPWCSIQHTYPLLMQVGDGWAPALFTTQRTGIKPSNAYLTSFARSKTPLYTVFTRLSLQAMKRGSVDYAVPMFTRTPGAGTDQEEWPFYAQQYRSIRELISRPRYDESESGAAPATPTAAAAPAATGVPEDDEVPF